MNIGQAFTLGLLCGVLLATAWYGLLAWVGEIFRD